MVSRVTIPSNSVIHSIESPAVVTAGMNCITGRGPKPPSIIQMVNQQRCCIHARRRIEELKCQKILKAIIMWYGTGLETCSAPSSSIHPNSRQGSHDAVEPHCSNPLSVFSKQIHPWVKELLTCRRMLTDIRWSIVGKMETNA